MDKNDSMSAQPWAAEMRHYIGAVMADLDPDDHVPDELFDLLVNGATTAALAVLSDAAAEAWAEGATDASRYNFDFADLETDVLPTNPYRTAAK
jgi:hypothetical protein